MERTEQAKQENAKIEWTGIDHRGNSKEGRKKSARGRRMDHAEEEPPTAAGFRAAADKWADHDDDRIRLAQLRAREIQCA